jgi:hypothetical protein
MVEVADHPAELLDHRFDLADLPTAVLHLEPLHLDAASRAFIRFTPPARAKSRPTGFLTEIDIQPPHGNVSFTGRINHAAQDLRAGKPQRRAVAVSPLLRADRPPG